MTLKIGIIGAGIMGADHAHIFAEDIPGVTLHTMCDADLNRAREIANKTGASHTTADPQSVIDDPQIDAVVIAAPDRFHAPLTLACIKAGKPVLVEKPLSQSSDECLGVMKAEEAAGRKFAQIGFMRRFDQSYTEMRSALTSGSLGRSLMMHNFHRNVETPAADFTGAMAITNSAPHEFDVARFVLGTELITISALQPKRSDARVAPVVMVLETSDEQLVTIEINNNAAYGYDVRGELVGESGSIALNAPVYSVQDRALGHSSGYASDWRPRFREAYRLQNKAFVEFVRTGTFSSIASDAWDGYCATMIAEAGVRALHTKQMARIDLISKPAFYAR